MMFDAACRAHGLVVSDIEAGRWVRVPTVDHPRAKNGAYKYLGDVGWIQNHATMPEVATWRPDKHEVARIDVDRIRRETERYQAKVRDGWSRAARHADELIRSATQAEHDYLHRKGFGDAPGLVLPDGRLMVPMRHWRTNALVGAQIISWDSTARHWDKKMIPGTRAKGAVLRLGRPQAPRSWLVEGYATGLSIEAAVRLLRLSDAVVICFSAGNLVHVAQQLGGGCVAFADHDESGTGERAAKAAGLPYVMSPVLGEDANDLHNRAGIFALAAMMVQLE